MSSCDYYAILGVGPQLKFKHAPLQESDDLERFQREIVNMEIVSVDETTTFDTANWEYIHQTLPNRSSHHEVLGQIYEANLDARCGLQHALQRQQSKLEKTGVKGIRNNIQSKFQKLIQSDDQLSRFVLRFQRRQQTHSNQPAVADAQLVYVRIHSRILTSAPVHASQFKLGNLWNAAASSSPLERTTATDGDPLQYAVELSDYLNVPTNYDDLVLPSNFRYIRDPAHPWPTPTVIETDSGSVEATFASNDPAFILPRVMYQDESTFDDGFLYIPALAIRRQRVTDEERFHEDAGIVNVAVSFLDDAFRPVLPRDPDNDEEEDWSDFDLLGLSDWSSALIVRRPNMYRESSELMKRKVGFPVLVVKRNLPYGFCDATFATQVQGRFPAQNYKGMPLPEEELPMFCYPTGCRLVRAQFSDAPLPQYYGFVVKNERGDSIYVSCVSFFEPVTRSKVQQLDQFSKDRRRSSLPHRYHCEGHERAKGVSCNDSTCSTEVDSDFVCIPYDQMTTFENKTICLVSRFPFWTAFRKFLSNLHLIAGSASELPLERLISHLLLSVPLPKPGGPSVLVPLVALNEPMYMAMPPEKDFPLLDLPYTRLFACLDVKTVVTIVLGLLALERKVIVLSTRPSLVLDVCELLRSLLWPFELCAPYVPRLTEPFKSSLDFPGALFVGIHDDGEPHGLAAVVRTNYPEDSIVVDLDKGLLDCDGNRFEIIQSIWDILPKSSRANLVGEIEALCRDAQIVDGQEPLDSLLDSAFYTDLPDAVDGFGVSNAPAKEPLDDRAIRDSFLRFFCSILGGYDRFLVVPDADFLVSGNEWFDTKGYLASVSAERAPFLSSFVATQLFQSFIQRRTEASDVQCLLFDECITEYHSTVVPYGRLGGDVEVVPASDDGQQPRLMYSLLVDQSSASTTGYDQGSIALNRSMDSEADSSFSLNISRASASVADTSIRYSDSVVDESSSIIFFPSQQDLPVGKRYTYFVDGNPCFPYALRQNLFLPPEPHSYELEALPGSKPVLARSDRELEESFRGRRIATSYRGFQKKQRRCLWQFPKLMGSHFLGSWLLCIPALVAQPNLSDDQHSRYLLQALGALRVLRGKQRIVPDEAAYRALMIALGRSRTDRRVELVKLFGLLRSDGIFPSAVTLGQYTKALAEGYSKRSSGGTQTDDLGVEVTESGNRIENDGSGRASRRSAELGLSLRSLDTTLFMLESQGRRWRQKQTAEQPYETEKPNEDEPRKKRATAKSWLPVVFSSSFVPQLNENTWEETRSTRLFALWSRTRSCRSCSYIPLEEEVQAGWDFIGGDHEVPGSIPCPRCNAFILPMLGYRELSVDEACKQNTSTAFVSANHSPPVREDVELPPQIAITLDDFSDFEVEFVTYLNPEALRIALEHYVEEYGEDILERGKLQELDREVFFNLWWYCARFSLPLPLSVDSKDNHACAFAAWDRSSAERGCHSAAKVITKHFRPQDYPYEGQLLSSEDVGTPESFSDDPLLSRFNLQGFYSTVWDHPDLSKLLVGLVGACDKRDFRPVVEEAIECNRRRRQQCSESPLNDTSSDVQCASSFAQSSDGGWSSHSDIDIYRTLLYLAKYQCTTAFHTFFPATAKPCKGYHFWCANGTPIPTFDRLLRDAVRRIKANKDQYSGFSVHEVSDVALGFRSTFGHFI